ncbi:hypothetical protein RUND412_007076 [Rhizina undulata]
MCIKQNLLSGALYLRALLQLLDLSTVLQASSKYMCFLGGASLQELIHCSDVRGIGHFEGGVGKDFNGSITNDDTRYVAYMTEVK